MKLLINIILNQNIKKIYKDNVLKVNIILKKHINKYNYDQEQFDSELIQNFDIKE